jgi:superfamily II DNA or RNA helicase
VTINASITERLLEERTTTPISRGPKYKQLRPYQLTDVDLLFLRERYMLYQEPGIGKTLPALEAMYNVLTEAKQQNAANAHILVVCPTYLTEQWTEVIHEQCPDCTVSNAGEGTKVDRLMAILNFSDFTIMNKEVFRTIPELPYNMYVGAILDESHHLRHPDTKMYEGAEKLAKAVRYLFLLTATPIMKEPDDLYGQFHLMFPDAETWKRNKPNVPELPQNTPGNMSWNGGLEPNDKLPYHFKWYNGFVDRYCLSEVTGFGRKIIGGRTKMIREELVNRYTSHRTYRDVGLYLPRLIENEIKLKMPADVRKRYNEIKLYWQDQYAIDRASGEVTPKLFINALQVMQVLRQVTCCEPKLEAVANLVQDTYSQGNATVVFCWYKDHATKLALFIQQALGSSATVPVITGDIEPTERKRLALRAINQGVPIVATLSSLSEGVDLSHAHTVVMAEEFYTPGMHKQAVDRVRRWSEEVAIEKHRPVLLYYTMMEDSVDEVIHQISMGRRMTIEEIVKIAIED